MAWAECQGYLKSSVTWAVSCLVTEMVSLTTSINVYRDLNKGVVVIVASNRWLPTLFASGNLVIEPAQQSVDKWALDA